jgi:hypothetical protein
MKKVFGCVKEFFVTLADGFRFVRILAEGAKEEGGEENGK